MNESATRKEPLNGIDDAVPISWTTGAARSRWRVLIAVSLLAWLPGAHAQVITEFGKFSATRPWGVADGPDGNVCPSKVAESQANTIFTV